MKISRPALTFSALAQWLPGFIGLAVAAPASEHVPRSDFECFKGIKDPYLAVIFSSAPDNETNYGPVQPCEWQKIEDGNFCYILPASSISSQARYILTPVGHDACRFWHEQSCDSDIYHDQYGNGYPLPEGWAGKLGAFACRISD